MVQMYTIFGRQVGSHYLAMATLGTTFLGAWYAMSGPKKQGPPLNATTQDEENFINEFIRKAEQAEQAEKAKH